MSIDQFHGCYPGDTTLSALGNATGSTPRNTSRNNSKTRQEYLKKKNLIITIIIFTNRKIYFHREYFTMIKLVIMIISGSPQSKVFFLGKVDFEPNITVKHDIKTVIYKVNQKFDHHTQPTNLLGLFSQIKPFFLLLGELNPIT